jgi:CheY-like chemotaxis protein
MGRRAGVALALVVVFAAVSPAPATAAEPARLEEKIRQRVRTFRGVLGVAATNLDTGEHVAFNGDVRFPTASLIKLAVMVETYHQIDEGKLARGTIRTLQESDKVGDEPVVLNTLAACVKWAGYGVLKASSGAEALALAARRSRRVDLVVCDVQLPDIDGPDLALEFKRFHPEAPFLFVAGNPDDPIVVERIRRPGLPFLAKPFLPHTLADAIEEVLTTLPDSLYQPRPKVASARHV